LNISEPLLLGLGGGGGTISVFTEKLNPEISISFQQYSGFQLSIEGFSDSHNATIIFICDITKAEPLS
jgi:hypothetical protein